MYKGMCTGRKMVSNRVKFICVRALAAGRWQDGSGTLAPLDFWYANAF